MNLALNVTVSILLVAQIASSQAIEVNDTLGSWASATMNDRMDLAERMSVQARTLKPNATPDRLFKCINAAALNSADWGHSIRETASICAIMAQ